MQHLLSEEQIMFGDAIGRFVDAEYACAPRGVRPPDRARMRRLAELGAFALNVPEALGGYGGAVETMVLHERLAPALAPEPVLVTGSHAAALIAAAAPDEVAGELLPKIALGEIIVAVAHLEPGMIPYAAAPRATVRHDDGTVVLEGRKALVPFGGDADVLLVSASDAAGRFVWIAVPRDTPGVTTTPAHRVDSLSAADIELSACRLPAAALLDRTEGLAALRAADNIAEAAQVAEMVGLMSALVTATIDYVSTRQQFGVPIGSFQSLRHRIADMWMDCEETRALAYAAALACTEAQERRADAVSIAKLRACDAADRVGAEAIQLHGAIGMTDEFIVSHWYRRLWALKLSLGDRATHLDRLAAPMRDFALV